MRITTEAFEAFLKCPMKCWLLAAGERGSGNEYAEWKKGEQERYRATKVEQHVSEASTEWIQAPGLADLKAGKWRKAANVACEWPYAGCVLAASISVLERAPRPDGKPAEFIPIRFAFQNKLEKEERFGLGFEAFVVWLASGRKVNTGKIIHGESGDTVKVKITALAGKVEKSIEQIGSLLANRLAPDLVLNRHCAECEFQGRCRQKAIEKDDLSLLAGMSEKERKKLHAKGIFTVTQLSYTFRPRRRSKRTRNKKERHHHALKALAIREKKIHVIGSPELKIEGTPVFLDVEGLPDLDFYYLIGVRIGGGDSAVQHSLWADAVNDEATIWREFLRILDSVDDPKLVYYGSYETTFLNRMSLRYGEPNNGSRASGALRSGLNLVSYIFGQIYLSAYSNGLKEIASTIGFNWAEPGASGLNAIVWRRRWEDLCDPVLKARLVAYNAQDCDALRLITEKICALTVPTEGNGGIGVVRADAGQFATRSKWRRFIGSVAGFEYINSAAHWDYQRSRVYARSGEKTAKRKKKSSPKNRFNRVEQVMDGGGVRTCPNCAELSSTKECIRARTLQDILFGRHSLKRRLVKYLFQIYRCRTCNSIFGIPDRFLLCRKYGWNLIAYFLYQIVELSIAQLTVVHHFNRLFGFDLNRSTMNNLKIKVARYYEPTKQKIIERIVNGTLIHADETSANIKGTSAYVWVLTSFREVVYILSESREGETVQQLLVGFKGILVSDFYTAYDSINCTQQKCLIHLLRDLNDAVLTNPFDDELKHLVAGFGAVLQPAIETIDRFGLKKYFLKKHMKAVDRFFNEMEKTDYQSQPALKCKERFIRNRETLFTFLEHDGVPWNNNNAEHAVKAFARLREVIAGSSTEQGLEQYLTLLSVCQTCKYMGVDFLDFLRSGEQDVHAFAAVKKR